MEILTALMNFILETINQFGIIGIFLGMTLESSLIPFPSEIILIPAGALIAKNQMQFIPVLIASILGSLLGAYINYYLGFNLGRKLINKLTKKYGKIFLLTPKKLERIDNYFTKHGEITTFTSRLIPGLRQIISIPAGFSKMNKKKFLIYTAIGSALWSIILIVTGILVANNIEILKQNQLIIYLIIAIIIISSLIIHIIKLRKNHSSI